MRFFKLINHVNSHDGKGDDDGPATKGEDRFLKPENFKKAKQRCFLELCDVLLDIEESVGDVKGRLFKHRVTTVPSF